MRGYHDIGGLPAGPIDRCEHDKALWEKRVHALLVLLARPDREVMNVDELRRGIESLGHEGDIRFVVFIHRCIECHPEHVGLVKRLAQIRGE